jgi:hypothetical protein
MNISYSDYISAKEALGGVSEYSDISAILGQRIGAATSPESGSLRNKMRDWISVQDTTCYEASVCPTNFKNEAQFYIVDVGKHRTEWVGPSVRAVKLTAKDVLFSSSTAGPDDPVALITDKIFSRGRTEDFEDGKRSYFALSLEWLIKSYKHIACHIISEKIRSSSIGVDLLCQAVRTIGAIDDQETQLSRFEIVVPFLQHASPFIRDCAGLALYDLEIPQAIPYIKIAIRNEKYKNLKRDLEKIVMSLEEIERAKSDTVA